MAASVGCALSRARTGMRPDEMTVRAPRRPSGRGDRGGRAHRGHRHRGGQVRRRRRPALRRARSPSRRDARLSRTWAGAASAGPTKLRIISRLTGAVRMRRANPHMSARPNSDDMPFPPWVWMAWSSAASAASAAAYLAMLAASPATPASAPESQAHAAFWHMRRASSTSILALASGWEIPWCRAMGVPHTDRSRA